MLPGLDTIRFHLMQLMERAELSHEARMEIEDAAENIQREFDALDRRIAELYKTQQAFSRRLNDLESYHN